MTIMTRTRRPFEALLSNATNGAVIGDGVGIGTITNSDLMPAARGWGVLVAPSPTRWWLPSRGRFAANPQTGLSLTLAGEALTSAPPLVENQQVLAKALGFETVTAPAVGGGLFLQFLARRGSRFSSPVRHLGPRCSRPPSAANRTVWPWMGT